MEYYAPGGGYGKGTEAALGRAETKAVASGTQALVSSGLAGTTMSAGLSKKFQEEVGVPTRARVEETRAQALSGLELTKAQIIQGATESERSRALQTYLARLNADAQIASNAASRQPVPIYQTPQTPNITPRTGGQAAYKFPPAPSLTGGTIRRSPAASYYGSAKFQR
jgi:hypothetical protein